MATFMKSVGALVLLSLAGLGCDGKGKGFDKQSMIMMHEIVRAMDEAGLAGYVEAELGQPGFIIEQKYGLDLGVRLRVRVMARPGGVRDRNNYSRIPIGDASVEVESTTDPGSGGGVVE